jgi:predicted RNase H-like HicB family nuclease
VTISRKQRHRLFLHRNDGNFFLYRRIKGYGSIKNITEEVGFMRQYKIIVEKHPDGYVAYHLGLKGVVVGQGDTYEEALSDVKSAIRFHIQTFGKDALDIDPPVQP